MDIYVGKDGLVSGAYDSDEVVKRLEDGRFDGSELAWCDGLGEWVNVKELLEGEDEPAETEAEAESEPLDEETLKQVNKIKGLIEDGHVDMAWQLIHSLNDACIYKGLLNDCPVDDEGRVSIPKYLKGDFDLFIKIITSVPGAARVRPELNPITRLDLRNNDFTFTEIHRFRQALPDCEITHDTIEVLDEEGGGAYTSFSNCTTLRSLESAINDYYYDYLYDIPSISILFAGPDGIEILSCEGDVQAQIEIEEWYLGESWDPTRDKLIETAVWIGGDSPDFDEFYGSDLSNLVSDLAEYYDLSGDYLSEISLRDNRISDVSALTKLTQLKRLWLQYNEITDVSPLGKLTQLTHLGVEDNSLDDNQLRHLAKLAQLTELSLSGNQITDVSDLKELPQLTELDLSRNRISDVGALKELTQLTSLNLLQNRISAVSPLKEFTQLISLYLDDNQISDVSALKELKQLTRLNLGNNQIPLEQILDLMEALPECNIYHNTSTITLDESAQAEVDCIKTLLNEGKAREAWEQVCQLNNPQICEGLLVECECKYWAGKVAPPDYLKAHPDFFMKLLANIPEHARVKSELKPLQSLDLSDNHITDAEPLAENLKELTQLKELNLSNNQISDMGPLKDLTQLTSLYLDGNQISDVRPLKELTQLTSLYLDGNQISDVSFLKELKQLTSLHLQNNPNLTKAQIAELKNALPECYIWFW